jgi:hypothetical protein
MGGRLPVGLDEPALLDVTEVGIAKGFADFNLHGHSNVAGFGGGSGIIHGGEESRCTALVV